MVTGHYKINVLIQYYVYILFHIFIRNIEAVILSTMIKNLSNYNSDPVVLLFFVE